MKILILGASGRVGQRIVKHTLAGRHDVLAFVRTPEKLTESADNLTVFKGNVLNKTDVTTAMEDVDLVVSALNTDKTNTLSKSMPILIESMKKNQLTRIITIGTAGILNSRTEQDLFRFQSNESKRRKTTAAQDHLAAFRYLENSNLDWTIVCPTFLPDGDAVEGYRVEKDFLPKDGNKISVGDTAQFAYSMIYNNEFLKTRVGIAY
ncbi:NAD(P)-dependent oxidoreductase [Virgibacillus sp. DJP39]|uniref:NAD(P)-dependent oxidoreductase n=1 Tax=Virgibacillus sp. DJP39 TaxID=3409790 RepID=UPI003BB4EB1C